MYLHGGKYLLHSAGLIIISKYIHMYEVDVNPIVIKYIPTKSSKPPHDAFPFIHIIYSRIVSPASMASDISLSCFRNYLPKLSICLPTCTSSI